MGDRELRDDDFQIITAADVALLELLAHPPIDDTDYSIFFDEDDGDG